MLALRTWVRSPRTRNDRGESDPVLVLLSIVVSALVVGGITLALVAAQKWGLTHNLDASEQTGEDAARMAWMADVGTSSYVIPAVTPQRPPAGKAWTAAQLATFDATRWDASTSVRFDSVTPDSNWPAGAKCRSVNWWLDVNATADPNQTGSLDEAGNPRKVTNVHRDVAYYGAYDAKGSCVVTPNPLVDVVRGTLVKNADRPDPAHPEQGPGFSYVNGNLRNLAYPAGSGTEYCDGVAKSNTAGLQACVAHSNNGTEKPVGRTLWEWADPTPVQVILHMSTTHAGTGQGYATQIGWREITGRRELTGNPNNNTNGGLTDTLENPVAPDKPATSPTVTVVNSTSPNDGTADKVYITRTDLRDLDGFEYRCQAYLDGNPVGAIFPSAGNNYVKAADLFNGTKPEAVGITPARVDITSYTKPGHAYSCQQRGWVGRVDAGHIGERFNQGVSEWSDWSTITAGDGLTAISTTTRRPQQLSATEVTGVTNKASKTFKVTWPARDGETHWDLRYKVRVAGNNADSTYPWAQVTIPAGTLSWTSPAQKYDTQMQVQVRPRNAGGVPGWATSNPGWMNLDFPAPTVHVQGPITDDTGSYTATWDAVPDVTLTNWEPYPGHVVSGTHVYGYRYRLTATGAWVSGTTTDTKTPNLAIAPGQTATVQVWVVPKTVASVTPPNPPGSGDEHVTTKTVTRRPARPTEVAGVLDDATGNIAWTWTAGSTGQTGYRVQWQEMNNGAWGSWRGGVWYAAEWSNPVDVGNVTQWTQNNRPRNTRTRIRVAAVNAGGPSTQHLAVTLNAPGRDTWVTPAVPNAQAPTSAWSTVSAGVQRKPAVPTFTLNPEGNTQQNNSLATWSDSANFAAEGRGGSYVLQYRDSTATSEWTTLTPAPGLTGSWRFSGLPYNHTGQVRMQAQGLNGGNSAWTAVKSFKFLINPPSDPTVDVTGQLTGTIRPVTCTSPATPQYSWDNVNWSTNRSIDVPTDYGVTRTFTGYARCVLGANASTSKQAPKVTKTVPWPESSGAWISNSGGGIPGSNITFNWGANNATYYRVYNAAGTTLRYSGGGTSVTVRRESGSTCAFVQAWYSQAAYNAGTRASQSGTTCGTTAWPVSSGAWITSSGSGNQGTNIRFNWGADNAGYFRVYNAAGTALRYSGGGTTVAVARESVRTCAFVQAWYSQAAYNDGVGPSQSGTACGDTLIPAPSVSGWSFSPSNTDHSAHLAWEPIPNATSYTLTFRWFNSRNGSWVSVATTQYAAGAWQYGRADVSLSAGTSVRWTVQAHGPGGSSSVRTINWTAVG